MQADTNKFSDVWCMNEEELKDIVVKVLDADKVIHTHQMGLEWVQPDLLVMFGFDSDRYILHKLF